jgi:ketol-acid reductoisomerase
MLPDETVPEVWRMVVPVIEPGAAVVFAHGYSLLFGELPLERTGDVVLVSPAGPGRLLEPAPDRTPLSAYLAVHRDVTGSAWSLAEDYARRLGCSPTWRTTVREETEVDLFGEQAVLCGGMNALVRTAFEVLVEAGYTPEIAYLECVHQLKHLADLMHERGVQGMRRSISQTALFGDVTRGPRVIGEASRAAMRELVEEIRSGQFAAEWASEVENGRPRIRRAMAEGDGHPMEAVRSRIIPAAASTAKTATDGASS